MVLSRLLPDNRTLKFLRLKGPSVSVDLGGFLRVGLCFSGVWRQETTSRTKVHWHSQI
jgi:hypothetical protein